MGKVQELIDLIDTKHSEWKNLTKLKLSEVSGYKPWACLEALQFYRGVLPQPKKTTKKPTKKRQSKGNKGVAQHPSTPFIDDPDELLYSVAIRMLNKPDPSPAWANVLITCREKIHKSKIERQSQLRKQPTEKLLDILQKSYGKGSAELTTSRMNSSSEE